MELNDIIQGKLYFHAIKFAMELNVFDCLEDSPKSMDELQDQLQQKNHSFVALIDVLEEIKFIHLADGKYYNSFSSKNLLVSKSPNYILDHMTYLNDVIAENMIKNADIVLFKNGEIPKEYKDWEKEEKDLFYTKDFDSSQGMAQGLSQSAKLSGESLAELFDFSTFQNIVDVGGNNGSFIAPIIKKFGANGMVVDLPVLEDHFQNYVSSYGLGNKLSFHGMSFFHQELPKAACFITRNVLHDFSDEAVERILTNIEKNLSSDGTLILAERLLDHEDSEIRKTNKINHLHLILEGEKTGSWAGERSLEHLKSLLKKTGFVVTDVIARDDSYLVCKKGEARDETNSLAEDVHLCTIQNGLRKKEIFLSLDTNGNPTNLIEKHGNQSSPLVFSGADASCALFNFLIFIKRITLIKINTPNELNTKSYFYDGQEFMVTYLKTVFPKLTYARRSLWLKKEGSTWKFVDGRDRKIDLL